LERNNINKADISNIFSGKPNWHLEIGGEINHYHNDFISYKLVISSYTGGAHSNKETYLFNVNPNGREMKIRSMIKDRSRFMEVAENAFRISKSLSATADLGEAGFTFEKNKFQLPENVGFTKKGVVLYYNDYEIGSYADGPTEITIPYDKLEGILAVEI
ncbi:MAG: RsiV family protein, partial [Proteobacteria bacterium]|nr:RsiV family protein [Pseudomonadota bacterium]